MRSSDSRTLLTHGPGTLPLSLAVCSSTLAPTSSSEKPRGTPVPHTPLFTSLCNTCSEQMPTNPFPGSLPSLLPRCLSHVCNSTAPTCTRGETVCSQACAPTLWVLSKGKTVDSSHPGTWHTHEGFCSQDDFWPKRLPLPRSHQVLGQRSCPERGSCLCAHVSTGADSASMPGFEANSWQLLLHPTSLLSSPRPGPPFICLVKRPIETHLSALRFTALVVNSLGHPLYLLQQPSLCLATCP